MLLGKASVSKMPVCCGGLSSALLQWAWAGLKPDFVSQHPISPHEGNSGGKGGPETRPGLCAFYQAVRIPCFIPNDFLNVLSCLRRGMDVHCVRSMTTEK